MYIFSYKHSLLVSSSNSASYYWKGRRGREFQSRSGEEYSIQHYVIKFVSDLRQVGGFFRVLWFRPYTWPPRYSWNIVDSGIKHHNLGLTIFISTLFGGILLNRQTPYFCIEWQYRAFQQQQTYKQTITKTCSNSFQLEKTMIVNINKNTWQGVYTL